jgi:integrase
VLSPETNSRRLTSTGRKRSHGRVLSIPLTVPVRIPEWAETDDVLVLVWRLAFRVAAGHEHGDRFRLQLAQTSRGGRVARRPIWRGLLTTIPLQQGSLPRRVVFSAGRVARIASISKGEGLGGRVDSSYVRRLLPRLAARGGIERRVHPHALRHSFATALAYEGKPLPVITAQLGHSSTSVTDRYLARIGPADLVALVRDRPRLAEAEE